AETDPVFWAHDARAVTAGGIADWTNAYDWGDHALEGYLTAEADPVYTASPAGGIGTVDIDNWNTAYGWGDHSVPGYLVTETDPVYTASPAGGIGTVDIDNWNTAYSWVSHPVEAFSSFETDPVFSVHDATGVTASGIANWDTAYGWGDHSVPGYLVTETDPVYSASPASGIGTTLIANWNTAYGWGDHSIEGYLTVETDPVFTAHVAYNIVAKGNPPTTVGIWEWNFAYDWVTHPVAAFLSYETDPIYSASPASGIGTTLIANWDTAYGWGDHSAEGYCTACIDPNDIANWDQAHGWGDHSIAGYLTAETDPVFGAHAAWGVTATRITNWDTAYGWGDHALPGYLTAESDPQVGAITMGYVPRWNGTALSDGNIYDEGSTGRIGFGTTSPSAAFEFVSKEGTTADNVFFDLQDNLNTAQLLIMGHTGGANHVQLTTDDRNSRITLLAGEKADNSPRLQIIGATDSGPDDGTMIFDYGSREVDLPAAKILFRHADTTGFRYMLTFDGRTEVIINDVGSDIDFRVEGGTDSNLFFADASTDRVGIGSASPAEKLEVQWAPNVDAGFFRGTTDTDITGVYMRDASGTKWYTWVDAGSHTATTYKP
ncbi:MAG: hypothetical protein GY864_15770, partial [Desulfobacterales bacterium]|nr:hypothetical protein [Desulfobacterales bacterium]